MIINSVSLPTFQTANQNLRVKQQNKSTPNFEGVHAINKKALKGISLAALLGMATAMGCKQPTYPIYDTPIEQEVDTTADEETTDTTGDEETLLVEEEPSVPEEETPTIPVEEEPTVPEEETPTIPVGEEPSVPEEETTTIPVEEEPTVPEEETPTIPVGEEPSVPEEETTTIPVEEEPTVPEEETLTTPVEEEPSVPEEEELNIPEEDETEEISTQDIEDDVPVVNVTRTEQATLFKDENVKAMFDILGLNTQTKKSELIEGGYTPYSGDVLHMEFDISFSTKQVYDLILEESTPDKLVYKNSIVYIKSPSSQYSYKSTFEKNENGDIIRKDSPDPSHYYKYEIVGDSIRIDTVNAENDVADYRQTIYYQKGEDSSQFLSNRYNGLLKLHRDASVIVEE